MHQGSTVDASSPTVDWNAWRDRLRARIAAHSTTAIFHHDRRGSSQSVPRRRPAGRNQKMLDPANSAIHANG